jgi:hypothetical protein
MTGGRLTIGDLAKATATKVETIRYYERIGLLPAPARTAGNYRAYGPSHLDRLSFVRHARELGFSIVSVQWNLAITHICGMQPWACAERPGLEALSSTDTHGPGARWIVPAGMPPPG